MSIIERFGFTRYEALLVSGILTIGALVFLPSIKQNIADIRSNESQVVAQAEVETFARSIRQFHNETGQWPAFGQGNKSSATMVGAMANNESSNPNVDDGLFAEKPMPLDPWNNPFLVHILDSDTEEPQEAPSIMVLSKGPNGTLDTELSEMWYRDISKRLVHPGNDDSHLQGDIFGGDDLGFVLSHLDLGGKN